ncbi:hypothetical protein M2102_000383 [Fusobacterium sp. PH5-7]|uniref:autotransporter family protein n=1 Tax=Fusobacterium sp. PH5-7 TaxID=2940528 RepID=UPI002475BC4D|nr:autotransporter outer membrane beta-barrel domain-containing protein [Fusobacterium sp. PH5-7]MDH6456768.1 hypothetical protein [Fusobacterium sp. PH5-7]
MIEKIMKAVKSGNKKRGRNITIGAVVGMLLSCTAVMGADEDKYLWVKENGSGALEFSTIDEGGSGNFEKNPYEENELTGNTYVNNMTLTGNNNGEDITIGGYSCEISYGIKLELTSYALNFVNNGVISGTGEKGGASVAGGYGIYILNNNLGEISNNGMISEGTLIEKPSGGTPESYAAGIHIAGDNSGNISNNGVIFIHAEKKGSEELTDINGYHYGIYIGNDNEKEIINNGLFILPKNKRIYIYTIRVNNDNKGDITNNGVIIGKIDQSSSIVNSGFTGIILWEGNEGTIKNNGMILSNGTAGGNGSDILEFGKIYAGKTFSNTDKEMNIFYDISDFENININKKITLFEKTVNSKGEIKDLEVTGAEVINIGENGALTLRIDTTNKAGEKIKGHALYGNNGTITSEGGRLLLALNGAGNESVISFGDTILGDGIDANTLGTTSKLHTLKKLTTNEVEVIAVENLPDYLKYPQLNKIYHGILSVDDLIGNFNVEDDEKLSIFLAYLNDIYAGNPYSYSSELSRKSAGMFRDIVTENIFRPETNKWMIYGGLTHVDGGTKDTYYGKGYYTYDIGSSDMDADTKITGAYMLGEYGVSDTLTSGVVIGGNKLKSDLSNGSKVDGSAMYLGAYAKKYVGNLKVTAGLGFQYGDYDADRMAVNRVASDSAESVMKYSDNYNDITYDIYLNGRYSHQVGDNLFLEPYATLSYTYIDQDGANEGSKTLAIETDSKSFDYTVGKVGVDLKKVIPHEKGKSTLTAGVSYTKILDGADEEHITGRFKGGSNFDILVAHKNEHSIGLNAKYALELESGVIFDVKGTYSVERDSHNQSGKNKTKGEWIVGAGLGYKF